jgi:hypothetical protein
MTDDQKAIYKRLQKLGKARAFNEEKDRRRLELIESGVVKEKANDRAFEETILLAEFALPPEASPAEDLAAERRARAEDQREKQAARLEESRAAWEKFHVQAGKSDSIEEWLRWAIEAATLAHEPGCDVPMWQKVTRPPPDMAAIAFAQDAFDPGKRNRILEQLVKLKQGGGDDGIIRAERKRVDVLLKGMLEEVDAEVAAKGINAYA